MHKEGKKRKPIYDDLLDCQHFQTIGTLELLHLKCANNTCCMQTTWELQRAFEQ